MTSLLNFCFYFSLNPEGVRSKQKWRSGESTPHPPTWPGLEVRDSVSRGCRVCFWFSSSLRVFLLVFLFSFYVIKKKNISIFQFNSESEGFRFLSVRLFSVTLAKQSRFWDLHNFLHWRNTEIATDNSLEITVKGKKMRPGD